MARWLLRGCFVAVVAAALGNAAWAAERPVPGPETLRPVRPLLDLTLDASGIPDGPEREAWVGRFAKRVVPLVQEAAEARSERRQATRLHRLLHARLFLKYRFDADEISNLLDRGEFNCVS